ncbi:MAG: DUF1993 domain-containing protein [Proteobacteria bacterium]|nr:DUF1993 domain-containing protein [Pseudomonadota bacterium]MBS0462735.1 DUF1993 domain-containing protein [Pseudomonadota bacterium]MBS0465055.1 DUF1993 domain-containing protein [Pseudomonadota bacterium]
MQITVFDLAVCIPLRMLHNLDAILGKAQAAIAAGTLKEAEVLAAKLAPDMFDFTRQVQLTSDFAKSAPARLAGVEVPGFADEESSLAQLRERIGKTIAFLDTFKATQFDGASERRVVVPLRNRTLDMPGAEYLLTFAQPNFYFHYTTAYGLLRHLGLEIGKRDFVG